MGRVLTILAAPPPYIGDQTTDDTIEAVREVLEQVARERADYSLENAFHVAKLADVLKRDLRVHADPPELVQVIGHGRPGILFLGATWTRTPSDERGTYVLECNLNKYNVLSEGVRPNTRVFLLGCNVGVVSELKSLGVADGPALLFALHRMWGAEVSAPYHMVTPDDFENGVYKFPDCLVTARGLRIDDATAKPPPHRQTLGVATPFLR